MHVANAITYILHNKATFVKSICLSDSLYFVDAHLTNFVLFLDMYAQCRYVCITHTHTHTHINVCVLGFSTTNIDKLLSKKRS